MQENTEKAPELMFPGYWNLELLYKSVTELVSNLIKLGSTELQ